MRQIMRERCLEAIPMVFVTVACLDKDFHVGKEHRRNTNQELGEFRASKENIWIVWVIWVIIIWALIGR